jgi:outer membrane lipoprotein-sorting protein
MKTYRSLLLACAALFCAVTVSAQTADEIISKYVQAIGGKDVLTKINSLYAESTMDVMGNQGNVKITTLSGKGMRQDVDVMGTIMTTCYNDKGGWSVNPMMGSTTAEAMPDAQYKSGKDQIIIGAPFVNYPENGYKAELAGNEAVGTVTAYKINMMSPDSIKSVYYFDPATNYLIKTVQQNEMQGQTTNVAITYSDYRATDGYSMPYKMSMDIADGQFTMDMTITKVQLNVPVNDSIFVKP